MGNPEACGCCPPDSGARTETKRGVRVFTLAEGPWPSTCLSLGSVSCKMGGWGDDPGIAGSLLALPFQVSSENQEAKS